MQIKKQINIFTVIYAFICIIIGLVINNIMYFENPLYYILTFILGVLIIPFIHLLIVKIFNYYTFLPVCKNNKCHTPNYQIINKNNNSIEYICNCHEHYLLENNEFVYLNENKEKIPYMARHGEGFPWRDYQKVRDEKNKFGLIDKSNNKD